LTRATSRRVAYLQPVTVASVAAAAAVAAASKVVIFVQATFKLLTIC